MVRLSMIAMLLICSSGCLPRTVVKPNPGPHDKGVRYYRPKPYLFVKPLVTNEGTPVDGMVSLSVEMLPDFSEEYSIHIRSGLGTNNTAVTLEGGWNLTSINVNIDSQTDENLEAVADVIGSIPTPTGMRGTDSMAIRAINVPMGLYEAVISKDETCTKQLYGFRYIGFLPYAACPTTMCGGEQEPCNSGQLYGLVFEEGAMVFRGLFDMSMHVDTERVDTSRKNPDQAPPLEVDDGFDT